MHAPTLLAVAACAPRTRTRLPARMPPLAATLPLLLLLLLAALPRRREPSRVQLWMTQACGARRAGSRRRRRRTPSGTRPLLLPAPAV